MQPMYDGPGRKLPSLHMHRSVQVDNVQHHGNSEGQEQLLFQKNGIAIAIAAQWSATSQSWIEVGQVMGSSDSY